MDFTSAQRFGRMWHMNTAKAQAALKSLENLSQFSRDSKIPRRTLARIVKGEGPIRQTTLMLVEAALLRLKPAKRLKTAKKGA